MKIEHRFLIGTVLITGVIVVMLSLSSEKDEIKEVDRLSKAPLGEKISEMKSPHVKLGASHEPYNSNPPTSGPHTGNDVAGPGIKEKPVVDEIVVHSLEHGAVVLWYRDDLKSEDINMLKNIFNEASGKKIMMPRSNMDTPIALTSWTYLMKLDKVDAEKIKEFIEINNDRGPEKASI
ncbi:MAG: DUF3105 domain-containing protein [Candidatus Pacebacteria bacterium]|nr:DUF3105 domain-containing protein [Candidatus Paceibacterota bacterium]